MLGSTSLKRYALLVATVALLLVSAATMAMTVRNSATPSIADGMIESLNATGKEEQTQLEARPAGADIEHATADSFESRVLQSTVPVLVDFYADWCGPCKVQDRILKEFASEFDGGKIVQVNVDESPELATRYDVQALPTLLIFQNGQVINRQVGLATKEQLKAALPG